MAELTVKQIKSKIKSTETKIIDCQKSIKGSNKWIAEFSARIEELKEKGGYTSRYGDESHFIALEPNRIENEISHSEHEVKYYSKNIRDYEKKINKYEAQLAEYRGMLVGKIKEYPVVRQFVDAWKDRCIEHISNEETIAKMLADHDILNKEKEELDKREKAKEITWRDSYYERCELEKKFHTRWGFVANYYSFYKNELDVERLERDYTYEADRKYDRLIEDVEYYVGEITNISELTIGDDGNLNGIVVGKNGKVKVQTILAGGYNIQCLHYRCLLNRIN